MHRVSLELRQASLLLELGAAFGAPNGKQSYCCCLSIYQRFGLMCTRVCGVSFGCWSTHASIFLSARLPCSVGNHRAQSFISECWTVSHTQGL